MHRFPFRRAFTLIELLVGIGIIGLLMGLLLPAVQKVREAGAATQCRNNLRQVAMGVIQFHDNHSAFPPARIVDRPGKDTPVVEQDTVTWMVRILPFIDRQSSYDQWDLTVGYTAHPASARAAVVSTYLCPSRRNAAQAVSETTTGPPIHLPCGCSYPGITVSGGAVTDFAGNHGDISPGADGDGSDFYWGGNGTGVIISSRGESPTSSKWIDRIRLADVRDGAANTFLIGEMHIPAGRLAAIPDNGPAFDGSRFFYTTRIGGPGVPISNGPNDEMRGMGLFAFGSWHPLVCHFAFVDGRVAGIKPTISTQLLERLCHRNDGNVVEIDE